MTESSNPRLLHALGAEGGIVCAIGAGGKKTTLYQLLNAHGGRVALTTTTFMTEFPAEAGAEVLMAPPEELLTRVAQATGPRVAYGCPSDKPGRVAGLAPEQIGRIHRAGGFALTLVKADGARMRRIKSPGPHEPSLPPQSDTVLLVLSALALGRPLSEKIAHRPERVAEITGLALGEAIAPAHLAALFAHPQGLLQGTAGARVIPVLNMVDSPQLHASAREVAALTLAASERFEWVALTSARQPGYLIERVVR